MCVCVTVPWRTLLVVFVGVLVALFHGIHCQGFCEVSGYTAFCGENQGLTEVPTGIPADVEIVYLQHNEISVIQRGIFSNLTQCQRLNLDNNKIRDLKAGMFDGLESLWELKLSNNAISIIEPGAFLNLQNIPDLKKCLTLYLDNNQITELRQGIFDGLESLEELYLSDNSISIIEPGIFMPLMSLDYLILNGNNISEVHDEVWTGLVSLKWLLLGENRIKLPVSSPVQVLEVFLQDNEISVIPSGIFSNLTQCQKLNLRNNMITVLGPGMFDGLVSIKELILFNNAINIIGPDTFLPLENLDVLYLNGNDISSVDAEMWTGLVSLKTLYLQGNRIKELSAESFVSQKDQDGSQEHTLQSLERLILSNNNLISIQNGAFFGLNLYQLSLGGNKLSEISGDIWSDSEEVNDLVLKQNQITVVRSNAFLKLRNLESINLLENRISSIEPGAFSGVAYKYFYLGLAWNDLSDLRGDMWNGISSIDTLDLDDNKLTEIRQDMWGDGLSSLDGLYLSNNKITFIHPGAFAPLSSLRSLYLGGNLLTEIHCNMWMGMNILRHLAIGNNKLVHIANKGLPKLAAESSLYLENNNLSTLSLGIFNPSIGGHHPQRLDLSIEQNPLHCDHRLCWLKEGEQEGWITYESMLPPDCANYPGVDWEEVDLHCEDGGSNGDTGIHGSGGGSGEIQ